MRDYNIEDFKEDIRTNREFDFTYKGKSYSLTYTKEGYIFTNADEDKYSVYNSYLDLLDHTRIEGKRIEEIIVYNLYDDLTIY